MRTKSDDLAILLAVVDTGGFSAAAESLDIQVARVSRAVSKVESQLGVTILNRTTRRIELTDEGRQFIDSVRVGLMQLQQAEEDIISRGELPKGRLRVDAASPFVFHQLVPLVQSFNQAYPDIELEITSNEGIVDLLEKKTDLAIRIGTLSDSTLHARSLGRSPLYIVASPEYISKRGLPTKSSDLAQHNLIGFVAPKILNDWPLKGFTQLDALMSSSNGETIRQIVLAGNGIACLSGFMVNKDIAEGRLISLLESEKISHPRREQVNAVYYKTSSVAKRISAFIDFIKPKLTL
ncbi:LysR substrate-binding domain-containing protein [Vibrio sp. 10N.286.52.C3]|uniref:LysR substrate-binding domain-containing protein n=1 Tax=Gammaproteobacteria TaxID=1236 RepID=UPI0002D28A94|nr:MULTISPECIES: LysR substrate-binding domain-containing protein [Gammaproteobacteria]ANP77952.1 LysR family transcriptional regulator [Vibrio crassostreae 9CS106]MDO6617777.1 LysR substrate-binding domain-containing protein [Shewanella sp. 6_MG-2023]MDO6639359.1 LysR substrate-binding domain-containing protein [Shewanella sp. 5_MG-2023]OED85902.1 LysR family transcriptional regulator [Vibrio crassostreae ZF-91]PMG29497.1 LysR family transcriptional regulator [Shewanella sp. 10N.286.52.C2]